MAGQQGPQRFHIVGGAQPQGPAPQPKQRVFTCTRRDTLRRWVPAPVGGNGVTPTA